MTTPNLSIWLRSLDLERYASAFAENDVDLAALKLLSDNDLQELGLSLGHRRKLLKALAELDNAAEPPNTTDSESDLQRAGAERRQLTVMFCDLVGSVTLAQRLDPEELRALMQRYRAACSTVIQRYDGHIARYVGDGILTYFGWPRAHEDDAERSIRAALEIVAAVKAVPASPALAVHIGIATGPVVVGEEAGETPEAKLAVGTTPNLAARLQGLAGNDQVVIASSTRRLVGNAFELVDLGLQQLKGLAEPQQAWRVERAAPAEDRFEAARGAGRLTSLVGRDDELALLLRRWDHAKTGEGQVALLCGEPGIGKSRITQALRERLQDEPHTGLRYQCSPYHSNSALHPVIEQLERAAQFAREDTAEQKLDKLEALLRRSATFNDETAALFAALLALPAQRSPALPYSPQKQREKTLEALATQLEALAQRTPLLVVFEDAHWIDATSQEALDLLIRRCTQLRMLLIVTHRPEYANRWSGEPHVTTLTLSRLSRRLGGQLALQAAHGKALPGEVMEQIVAKTDGVPLFIEELTKTVIESGLLIETETRYELQGPLPALAIPSTLQDSLMARLDKLGSVKEVAQLGACIGRGFGYELLAAVSPLPQAALLAALQQLEKAELVFVRGTPPEATYTFKHALVQDVAYESLLKSRRQQLHAAIAQALEARFPELVANQPEILAHHFAKAELHDKAARYWSTAGQNALARCAALEAIGHFNAALTVLPSVPLASARDRVELQTRNMLSQAYTQRDGWGARSAYDVTLPALEIAYRLDDVEEIMTLLIGRWLFHVQRDAFGEALRYIGEVRQLAADKQYETATLYGHFTEALTRCWMGEFRLAHTCGERALSHYDAGKHRRFVIRYGHEPRCALLVWQSWWLWALGYPQQAREATMEQLALAREIGHAWNLIWALQGGAGVLLWRGEYETARKWNIESRELALTHGLHFAFHNAPNWGAPALIGMGEHEAGYAEISEGERIWAATGALNMLTWTTSERAKALAGLGRIQEAIDAIKESLEHSQRTGQRIVEAEAHRLHGEFMLLGETPDPGAAAAAFKHCLEIARSQDAKSFELRGAMSLARLWRQQGERIEARNLLERIYNWFTEGFDTKDLKEAKALLDELKG